MVAATILAAALAAFGLYFASNRSNIVSVERQIRTTQRAIDDVVARLALEQETVAVWDDAADHLNRPRLDMIWMDGNMGDWLHKIFGHDQTFILNAQDRPIYGSVNGHRVPSVRFEPLRPAIRRLIDDTRGRGRSPNNRFDRHPGQNRPGEAVLTTERAIHDTQIVNIDGRPAAVSVMQVRASTPSLRRPGVQPVMVTLRFLDGGFLHELESRNLIDHPRFAHAANAAANERALPIASEDGGLIGYFIWRPELPGSRIMNVLAPTTALAVLAIIALMAILALWLRRAMGNLHNTVMQLSVSEARAQHMALHDTLTGLPNRAFFNERLDWALCQARRGEGLAVLMLDLDRFKYVNDTLGHLAGDQLIREFGARVASLLRKGDTVARLGGDEFAVLLPGIGPMAEVEALCGRLLEAVSERFEVPGGSAFVGVSIGVVTAPEASLDRVDLMRKADIALYRAKAEGRACYRLFTECMDELVRFRGAVEEDLRIALSSGQGLRVHYQPEVANDGHTIVGLEALVRWQHPERGLISPDQFVPVAEETGLICALGEWVLRESCRVALRWPDLFIAVNLSPAQFRVTGFADRVIEIVREAGVDPRQIELEVTEGILLDDDDLVRASLKTLRSAGLKIALDDFGTGYSSFSYLRQFDVDKIKIDRSFVQHLGHRIDSASIISAVLTIGHAMGLIVTAEGVETKEQLDFLSSAGCDQMQGFLFSRALPEQDIVRLLEGRKFERQAA